MVGISLYQKAVDWVLRNLFFRIFGSLLVRCFGSNGVQFIIKFFAISINSRGTSYVWPEAPWIWHTDQRESEEDCALHTLNNDLVNYFRGRTWYPIKWPWLPERAKRKPWYPWWERPRRLASSIGHWRRIKRSRPAETTSDEKGPFPRPDEYPDHWYE